MGKFAQFQEFWSFMISFFNQPARAKAKFNPAGVGLVVTLKAVVFLLLVTCLLLVAGCRVVGPDYVQPVPQMLSNDFKARASIAERPTSGLQTWWQNFADPTLNQLVSQALQKNLTVQQAAERIVEARATVNLNGGQLAPNVDYVSDYQFLKLAPNARPFAGDNIGRSFSLFRLGFDSTWEIDLFGRIERSIQAAEADMLAQQFSLQDIQQTLVADVATSYLTIRLLQSQIDLIEESLQLQQSTQQIVEDRQEAGLSTQLDTEQTIAFLHRTRAAKVTLEQQLGCEFNRLSILAGESPAQPIRDFVGRGAIPNTSLVPEIGIPADLIRRRPDVRRLEAEVIAATARIGVAEADLYPTLTLLGSISLGATDPSSLFQSDSLAFSLGPAFRWNILNFGRIQDNIEIHESRLRQTVFGYRQTILEAVQEVEDAIVKHDGFERQLSSLQKASEADRVAVELSLERYRVGKANFQRVLDAQLQYLQDSRDQAAAQANANIQLIRLYRAIGGGWPQSGAGPCQASGHANCTCESCGVPFLSAQEIQGQPQMQMQTQMPSHTPTPAVNFQHFQPTRATPTSGSHAEDFTLDFSATGQSPSKLRDDRRKSLHDELFDWGVKPSDEMVVRRDTSSFDDAGIGELPRRQRPWCRADCRLFTQCDASGKSQSKFESVSHFASRIAGLEIAGLDRPTVAAAVISNF